MKILRGARALGGSSLSNFTMGIGESRVILWSSAATLLLGAPLALILIPRYQIVGLIATLIVAPRLGWVVMYTWMKRITGLDVDWLSSARIYVCSAVSFAAGYLALSLLHLTGWVALISGTAIFFVFYLVALPLSRTLSGRDIVNFKEMTKITGPFSPIFGVILSLIQRLASI